MNKSFLKTKKANNNYNNKIVRKALTLKNYSKF